MGVTYGDDTVLLVFPSTTFATEAVSTLGQLMA